MDKEVEDNYSDNHATADFAPFDFSRHILRPQPPPQGPTTSENSIEMVDFILNNQLAASDPPGKLSFTDVMQFADFGPKLALLNHNQSNTNQEEDDEDEDSYFFKFNLMNERMQEEGGPSMVSLPASLEEEENNSSSVMQQNVNGGLSGGGEKAKGPVVEGKNRRKRGRSMKTSEEVESQRMTHIAVERNRRRQMNEHLRVLRSLMPGSYVQRGDQASIIGGAIEFVRELEQLLQCLESQRRRRLFGESGEPGGAPRNMKDNFSPPPPLGQPMMQPHSGHIIQQQPLFFPPLPLPSVDNNNMRNILDLDLDPTCSNDGPQEEVAENKSCIADIEVRVVGPSALIKILSRRRPGQLIKTIAALEDLQFCILHTNITTIEQTVLYSFNVKNTGEGWRSAEEIANSIQQILSFIDTSTI